MTHARRAHDLAGVSCLNSAQAMAEEAGPRRNGQPVGGTGHKRC